MLTDVASCVEAIETAAEGAEDGGGGEHTTGCDGSTGGAGLRVAVVSTPRTSAWIVGVRKAGGGGTVVWDENGTGGECCGETTRGGAGKRDPKS